MRKSTGWYKTVTGYRVYSKVNCNCPRLNVLYNFRCTCTLCTLYKYCTFRIIDRDGDRDGDGWFRFHASTQRPTKVKNQKRGNLKRELTGKCVKCERKNRNKNVIILFVTKMQNYDDGCVYAIRCSMFNFSTRTVPLGHDLDQSISMDLVSIY